MALIDDVKMDIYATTGIQSILPKQPEPPTEEEQLQQFIRSYINEPPPKNQWSDILAKYLTYPIMYGGRGHGKTIGYHKMIHQHIIIDDFCTPHENPTLKPTKKQAKLLKKFRKLKRFK